MYLFYVVTTNILLCIFSFFADVLSYNISHGPCRLQIEAADDGYMLWCLGVVVTIPFYSFTFLLFYFFTLLLLKAPCHVSSSFILFTRRLVNSWFFIPHFGAISMSAGDWLTKRSTMMSLRRRSR